jgi:1,4-alpha-glucan branching enzyme
MSQRSGVEFTLFAPYNEDVKLIGSWNNWEPIAMQRDAKGHWRVEVPLDDGVYEYKFDLISKSWFAEGKRVQVADPKAIRLSLARENAVITVNGGKRILTTYQWQHDDKPLPDNDQLIIYELHVGDFTGGPGDISGKRRKGNFQDVIDKLDYLVDLGINAIEFMPLNEFPGHHNWGYSQRSIYAVENSYGTADDLCRLVDECHARGIRVIHDAVYNHMEMDAPLTQIDYTYWFYGDNPDGPELDFGPKFNYEHHDENLNVWPARQHVIQAMRFWVDTFHLDGIRFDCTRALRYYDLLRWFHEVTHSEAEDRPFYTIAEHVPQDPTVAGPEGPVDAAWHENFAYQMMDTVIGVPRRSRDPFNTNEVLRLMDARNDGFAGTFNAIHYIDNHDQDRIMWQLGAFANTFDDAAFRRMKLGASLLLTAPSVPMIWMGQEFGEVAPKTLDRQPLDWILLDNERNRGLFNHYKALIHLRKTNPALYSSNYEPVMNDYARGLLAFKRWNHEGNVIVVVANLRDRYAGGFEIGGVGLEDGVWHEYIHNYDNEVSGGVLRDSLAESEVKIFIKQ